MAVTAVRHRAISCRQGEFNNPQGRDACRQLLGGGGSIAAVAVWRQQRVGGGGWQLRRHDGTGGSVAAPQ